MRAIRTTLCLTGSARGSWPSPSWMSTECAEPGGCRVSGCRSRGAACCLRRWSGCWWWAARRLLRRSCRPIPGSTRAGGRCSSSGPVSSCGSARRASARPPANWRQTFPTRTVIGQAWIDWSLLSDVGTKSQITIHQLCDTNGSLSQNADDGTGGDQTTSTLQGMFAQSAFCAWTDAWLRAKVSGDTAAASSAASEIAGALQWPASQAARSQPRSPHYE